MSLEVISSLREMDKSFPIYEVWVTGSAAALLTALEFEQHEVFTS